MLETPAAVAVRRCFSAQEARERREELVQLQEMLHQQLALTRGLQAESHQQQQTNALLENLRRNSGLSGVFGQTAELLSPNNRRYAAAIAAALGRWSSAVLVKDASTAHVKLTSFPRQTR